MVFDRHERKFAWDGEWHCPFTLEWVEQMKKAVDYCNLYKVKPDYEFLSESYYEFLSEPQDARGLPLSYCIKEERRFNRHPVPRPAIYDYCMVPEIVATNGYNDWPVRLWEKIETL